MYQVLLYQLRKVRPRTPSYQCPRQNKNGTLQGNISDFNKYRKVPRYQIAHQKDGSTYRFREHMA